MRTVAKVEISFGRPTRLRSAVFQAKVVLLRWHRTARNWQNGPSRHNLGTLEGAAGSVEHRSALWTSNEPAEQHLQMGKVQNLRVAVRHLDGVLIPAGATFSFWRQVGKATRRRGFVDGRELREGCIIATTGGGLCQLSNALHELALRSRFEILERHPHTQPVPGAAWVAGRDATVAWNHIDLRFRSPEAFRIRARLSRDELVVSFETAGSGAPPVVARRSDLPVVNTPGSCETCGHEACFRHEAPAAVQSRTATTRTAFLLDAAWPEFDRLLSEEATTSDLVMRPRSFDGCTHTASMPALWRSINARRSLSPPQRRALQIRDTDRIADSFASRLPFDATELVVDLTFLKALYRQGSLGGRGVTVWLTRFPLKLVHELLDGATKSHPDRPLLADFRADASDVEDEWQAVVQADRIVTPHAWLAKRMRAETGATIEEIPWILPAVPAAAANDGYLYFPGPTASREGAVAVREAARLLGLPVSVDGRILEEPDFWKGIDVFSPDTHPMSRSAAVVAPAVMKSRPSALLAALAMGKKIIATPQCGLSGVIEVPFGDADVLVTALSQPGNYE